MRFNDPDGRAVIELGFGLNLVVKGGVGFNVAAQFDTENYQLGGKLEGSARMGLEVGANFGAKISPSSGQPAISGDDSEFFANVSGGYLLGGVEQDIGTVKLSGPNKWQASGPGEVGVGGAIMEAKFNLKAGASAGAGLRAQGKTDIVAQGVAKAGQLISDGKQLISDTKDAANSLVKFANRVENAIDTVKNILNTGPKD